MPFRLAGIRGAISPLSFVLNTEFQRGNALALLVEVADKGSNLLVAARRWELKQRPGWEGDSTALV